MTYRHLNLSEAVRLLERGVSIQQWLGTGEVLGFRILRWISVFPLNRGGFSLFQHQSLDEGNEQFIDIVEFADIQDPDQPEGLRSQHESLDEVLQRCWEIGAQQDRFVQFCEAQYIYLEFLRTHGPPARDPAEWYSPG